MSHLIWIYTVCTGVCFGLHAERDKEEYLIILDNFLLSVRIKNIYFGYSLNFLKKKKRVLNCSLIYKSSWSTKFCVFNFATLWNSADDKLVIFF